LSNNKIKLRKAKLQAKEEKKLKRKKDEKLISVMLCLIKYVYFSKVYFTRKGDGLKFIFI